jgi:hypothetical protein
VTTGVALTRANGTLPALALEDVLAVLAPLVAALYDPARP